jgi:hypothetical protein
LLLCLQRRAMLRLMRWSPAFPLLLLLLVMVAEVLL